jgi:hypothetical protein
MCLQQPAYRSYTEPGGSSQHPHTSVYA